MRQRMTKEMQNSEVWVCSKCNIPKPRTEFRRRKAYLTGFSQPCQNCSSKYSQAWKKSTEKGKACVQKGVESLRNYNQSIRAEIVEAYGSECACCGESEARFLTIDHINNDGAKHRREIGAAIYLWLKKNGFPKNGFQLLCCNCNFGRQFNGGICPHLTNK